MAAATAARSRCPLVGADPPWAGAGVVECGMSPDPISVVDSVRFVDSVWTMTDTEEGS